MESLVEAAFGRAAEAHLVARIRASEGALSLVAEAGGVVVGHILFTRVGLVGATQPVRGVGLAPMAVAPALQRSGIGSKLVRAGLAACAERGEELVFVLGHPGYYPRFGFVPAGPRGLHYGDGSHDDAFFVHELRVGAADGRRGRVAFLPEFDAF